MESQVGEGRNLATSGEFSRPDYGSGEKALVTGAGVSPTAAAAAAAKDWKARMPRRYYLVALLFLGFFNVYAMRVNMSIAVLYIMNNRTVHYPNGTVVMIPSRFAGRGSVDTGLVLSSFFYGYIFTQLPGGWLACRYGGKLIYGIGIILSACLALATPMAVSFGYWALIALRVLQGFVQGVAFPSMQALLSHWSPLQEKTVMATIAVSGCQFGTVVALPLSAALADSFEWPSIFYFFGLVGLVWGFLWITTVGGTPHDDKWIANDELKYITASVGYTAEQVKLLHERLSEDWTGQNDHIGSPVTSDDNAVRRSASHSRAIARSRSKYFRSVILRKAAPPPWKQILTSGPVWAIVAVHFSENWGYYIMLTDLPTYLAKVFNFSTASTGFLSALPYLALGFTGISAGALSDYLRVKRSMDTILVRKLFTCIPLILQAVFVVITAHVYTASAAMTFIVLTIALGGFVWSAFAVNQLDIAPQYAGVLMGISNTVATIPGIAGPALVGLLAPHNYVSEWQIIFYIIVSINLFGAAVYAIFGSATRQRWAEISGSTMMTLDDH